MKLSLNWLNEYISLKEDPETLSATLTQTGLEVEGLEEVESIKGSLKGIVVGHVLECSAHPNADKLSITQTDVGAEAPLQIVCGAPNIAKGQKVLVALPGTTLYTDKDESFVIKKSKIRGEVSNGMICAEDEIGLGQSHEGILVLDTKAAPGTPASEIFDVEKDVVFEIGLTPNRGDAASHFGAARDLFAFYQYALKKPSPKTLEKGSQSISKKLEIHDDHACPRYVGRSLVDCAISESPEWLQKRLKSIGLNPKNNAVDTTNYMLHGFGQPMHVFDAEKLQGDKVIIRRAKEGEKLVTLDEVERELNPLDLVIADESGPIALAGVMGGLHSAVTTDTKQIYLESAYFHPDVVRATSTRHGIKSDASFRYERGTDPEICAWASDYAASLLAEICGAKAGSEAEDLYPNKQEPKRIPIEVAYIQRLIGKEISLDEITGILERLDIRCEHITHDGFEALVPAYRWDVTRKADLVEEVLRIYGFNNVEISGDIMVPWVSPTRSNPEEELKDIVRARLSGQGFSEMMTNSLTSPSYAEKVEGFDLDSHVIMQNHSSADLSVMRQALFFTGLESVARNINRRQSDLALFEFGKVYAKTSDSFSERWQLALFMTGQKRGESWIEKDRALLFQDIKTKVDLVLSDLRAKKVKTNDELPPYFAYGLNYVQKGKTVAQVGLLHPKYAKLWDIKQEVFYAVIEWETLALQYDAKTLFQEIPKFPSVRRDLSVVLDAEQTFQAVEKECKQVGQPLLKETTVFDVYAGEHLPEGKKSYSVAFTLQDVNKTLEDKQIDKVMDKIILTLEKKLAAEIRR